MLHTTNNRQKRGGVGTIQRISLVVLAVLVVVAFTTGQSQAKGMRTQAVLAGGGIGASSTEIFADIVEKAGGAAGNICVVPVSSWPWTWDYEDCLDDGLTEEEAVKCADEIGWKYGNSKINIDYYGEILEDNGIGQYTGIYIDPMIREENRNPDLVKAAKSCSGFFFTGGDQSRGIYALRNDNGKASPVLKAIKSQIRKGAVMAGTSAGTAIQTKRFVIANGFNPLALTEGAGPAVYDNDERELVYADGVCDGCDDLLYNRFKGVGNFKYGITDTHFSDRERALRLLRLLADTRRDFGFGVDTATSLSVDNGVMTVKGQDGVTILDLSRAKVIRRAEFFGIRGVKISYIRPGDTYDAKKRRFHLAGDSIDETDSGPIVNNDIMDELDAGGFQMVSLLSDLAKSTRRIARGYSDSKTPQYRVTLKKGRRTQTAIQGELVSVANVRMTVEAVK